MTTSGKQPVWIIPLIVAGLVALLGWWGNERLSQTIGEELRSDLYATLDANVTALQIWTTNQMRMAPTLAEEPSVQKFAARILDPGSQDGLGNGANQLN